MTVDLELQRRRIKGSRRAIGLSRWRVERFGAMTPGALANIERGTRPTTVPEILGIAHATGVPTRYLIGHTGVVFRTRGGDCPGSPAVRDRMELLLAMSAELEDLDAGCSPHVGLPPRTW